MKCYLLPDKTKLGKRKSTVKKKTMNPIYNEILRVRIPYLVFYRCLIIFGPYFTNTFVAFFPKFKITMEVLKTQDLNISVWHSNTFGRNSFLGEVDLDLSEWDFSNTHINEYALKARVKVSFLYTVCVYCRSDLIRYSPT